MGEIKSIQILAAMNAEKKSATKLEIQHLGLSDRLLNSAKTLGLWWLAAIFFVFVPVLHFFLVPLAFVLGIVFAYRRFILSHRFGGGTISCPSCQAEFPADAKPFNWPQRIACPQCHSRLVVEAN